MTRLFPLLLLAIFAIACGGSHKPVEQLSEAEKSIERARAIGAADTPRAALHLKMARDQVAEGKRRIDESENDLARHNLRRAAADAELAEALTREQHSTQEAKASHERLEQLRQGNAAGE
jgi:hypothetical protein